MRNPLIALAAAAALVTTPAFAAGSKDISYRDLDLSTSHGQQELDRRIDAAARTVCGLSTVRTGTVLRSAQAKACYQQASNNARAMIAARIKENRLGG